MVRFGTVLIVAALLAGPSAASAASVFAGPPEDVAFTDLAAEMSGALWSRRRLSPVPVADSLAALGRLAQDPDSVAISELALVLDADAHAQDDAHRLDFLDIAGQRCLVVFVQKGGWVRSFADLAVQGRGGASGTAAGAAPGIGVAGPNAAALMALLQRFDPALAGLDVQTGRAEELAVRVARGTLDALLVSAAFFRTPDRGLIRLAEDERFTRIAPVTREIARAATSAEGGMALARVRIDRDSLIAWPRAPEEMLCSPLGVALRGDAPRPLRAAVEMARPKAEAALEPSPTERMAEDLRRAVDEPIAAVRRLLNRD